MLKPPRKPMPEGKRRLIAAAARLATRQTHAMPGLRELAREAGLNHNTFYRHFANMDDLQNATVQSFAELFRTARATIPTNTHPPDALVATIFAIATTHQDAFTLAIRILHGAPTPARARIQSFMDTLTEDLATELKSLGVITPTIPPARLHRLLSVNLHHVLTLAQRQIETQSAPHSALAEAGELLTTLLAGAPSKTFFF
jgi:AcrR family transcriptional regulator